jgi:hypothetical protein
MAQILVRNLLRNKWRGYHRKEDRENLPRDCSSLLMFLRKDWNTFSNKSYVQQAILDTALNMKDLQAASTSGVFVALNVSDCATEPTPKENDQLAKVTEEF